MRAVPALAPGILRLLLSTCTRRSINPRIIYDYVIPNRPYVAVVWHKDILFVLNFFRGRKIAVMVSRSKDGELVARTLERVGYKTTRGSSSSGGGRALSEMIDLVQKGWAACFIADGPRGPARQAKLGCVYAARDLGLPILTFGCDIRPCHRLRNWDQTILPSPFARVVVAYGEPIYVPPSASREECERVRQSVDQRMAELEAACTRTLESG
jgi:lysophospholipid acyltransferase (LPLAT)-like uncharacterized protein